VSGHADAAPRGQELAGQTVVVIGGSAGIGLETARRARAEGASVILTAATPAGSSKRRPRLARKTPRPSMPPTSTGWRGSSRTCPHRSTTCWSPAPGRTTRRWQTSTTALTGATYDIDGGQQLIPS